MLVQADAIAVITAYNAQLDQVFSEVNVDCGCLWWHSYLLFRYQNLLKVTLGIKIV